MCIHIIEASAGDRGVKEGKLTHDIVCDDDGEAAAYSRGSNDSGGKSPRVLVQDPLAKGGSPQTARSMEDADIVNCFFLGETTPLDINTTNNFVKKAKEILGNRENFSTQSIELLLATLAISFLDDGNTNENMGVSMIGGIVEPGVFQYDPESTRNCIQTHRLGVSQVITPIDVDVTTNQDRMNGFSIVRTNSFISSRVSSSGIKGPEALFGRFKISVSMTRSLGGRYGPRRCICLPDVIALDVLPGQNVRCVLATDGLWDVVSLQSIAKVLNKHEAPTSAAKALTEKALKRREDRGLRLDDITVVVVDINVKDDNLGYPSSMM